MRQFVSLLVQRLRMHVGELVMAYALVESVLRNFPTTMRVNSVRPLLLGACFIACKTARDEDLELCQVAVVLLDVGGRRVDPLHLPRALGAGTGGERDPVHAHGPVYGAVVLAAADHV